MSVGGEVGYLEVQRQARLHRAVQVSGAAELEVGFGYTEAVVGCHHDIHSFACIGRHLRRGEQYAITLVCPTPYSASELVQLTQPKALRIFYNHHRSVRHVHTYLYHRRGYQDLRLAAHKPLHLRIFVGSLHLAVHHRYAELREGLHQVVVAVLQICQIQLFVLLNKRIHHIHLPAHPHLLSNKLID